MVYLKRSYIFFLTLLFILCAAAYASAQVQVPRPSQKASVMQRIGVTDITITYSRPGVKGRTIWGDALPEQANVKGEATLDNQNLRPKERRSFPGDTFGVRAQMKLQHSSLLTTSWSTDKSCRPEVTACTQFRQRTNGPSSSMAPLISGAVLITIQPKTRCVLKRSRRWWLTIRNG